MHLRTEPRARGESDLVRARNRLPRQAEGPGALAARRRGSVRRGLLWLAVVVAPVAVLLYFYIYGESPGPDDLRAGAPPAGRETLVPIAPPAAPAQPAPLQPAPAQAAPEAAAPAPPAPAAVRAPASPAPAANRFAGVWKVKAPEARPTASESEKLAAGFASAFVPAGLSIDLRGDGTFTATILIPMEGTWTSDGDICALSASRWNGMTATEYDRGWEGGAQMPRRSVEPIRLRISDDGARLNQLYDDGTVEDHYSYVRSAGDRLKVSGGDEPR